MGNKIHIDTAFREVVTGQGPSADVRDEELFLQNLREWKNSQRRKKRFGLFLVSILGLLCISAAAWFGLTRNDAAAVVKAKSPTVLVDNGNPTKPMDVEPAISMNAISKPNTESGWNNNKISKAEVQPGHDLFLVKDIEPPTEIIQDKPLPEEQQSILDVSNVHSVLNLHEERKQEHKLRGPIPCFSQILRPRWLLSGLIGPGLMNGKCEANPVEKSHKDMASFLQGVSINGKAFSGSLSIQYLTGRWRLASGVQFQYAYLTSTYQKEINNIPVIDSASGEIKAYLYATGANAYRAEKQSETSISMKIPLILEFQLWKNARHYLGLNCGILAHVSDNSNTRMFDINTMENAKEKMKASLFHFNLGAAYEYQIARRWGVRLAASGQQNNYHQRLQWGSSRVQLYNYSLMAGVNFQL